MGEHTPAPATPASVRASLGMIVQFGYESAIVNWSCKIPITIIFKFLVEIVMYVEK